MNKPDNSYMFLYWLSEDIYFLKVASSLLNPTSLTYLQSCDIYFDHAGDLLWRNRLVPLFELKRARCQRVCVNQCPDRASFSSYLNASRKIARRPSGVTSATARSSGHGPSVSERPFWALLTIRCINIALKRVKSLLNYLMTFFIAVV